jgi:hypothetical protein
VYNILRFLKYKVYQVTWNSMRSYQFQLDQKQSSGLVLGLGLYPLPLELQMKITDTVGPASTNHQYKNLTMTQM